MSDGLEMVKRHPGTLALLAWFGRFPYKGGTLVNSVSVNFHEQAQAMARALPDSPELTAGLRKLLEARDCMVRAAWEHEAAGEIVRQSGR